MRTIASSMMVRVLAAGSVLAAVSVLGAGTAHAACKYPKAPDGVPNGATATREQMIDAQQAVKEFDRAIAEYTECLRLETEAAIREGGKDMTEERKRELELVQSKKHNAAVDAAQALADRFNEQVKVYRETEKNSKK